MNVDRLKRPFVSPGPGADRRQALGGLIAGAAAALVSRREVSQAKKRRKKCKKPKTTCDRCPFRPCCLCYENAVPTACLLLDVDDDFQTTCAEFCGSSLRLVQSAAEGVANFCATNGDCVAVECPVL